MTSTEVPPTEPTKKADEAAPKNIAFSATIGADVLMPARHVAPNEKLHWFWIGSLPTMPLAYATVGGLCFPKVTELVLRKVVDPREQKRVEIAGELVKVSVAKMREVAEAIGRSAVRWVNVAPEALDLLSKDPGRPRPGTIVKFQTTEKRAEAARNNLYTGPTPQAGDEPLAKYLFAKWLGDDVSPISPIGAETPPPLSETGLSLPPENARAVPDSERPGFPSGLAASGWVLALG